MLRYVTVSAASSPALLTTEDFVGEIQSTESEQIQATASKNVTGLRDVLKEALTTDFNGLKVIIAEGECQLERQRRIRQIGRAHV